MVDQKTSGSGVREARDVGQAIGTFDLEDQLAEIDGELEDGQTKGDRSSRTLVHREGLRIVLTRLRDGAEIGDHESDQGVPIIGIEGTGELSGGQVTEKVERRLMVTVAGGTDWTLRGRGDLVALMVFGGRGEAAGIAAIAARHTGDAGSRRETDRSAAGRTSS